MKYVKLFESFSDFYEEISMSSFLELYKERIIFSSSEIDIISKISEINGMKFKRPIPMNSSDGLLMKSTSVRDDSCSITDICIYKLPDEWFIVRLVIDRQYVNGPYIYPWYKCDQIEGLQKLLSDLL